MSHETYELKAEARERVGKGSARELRRNGLIPAVIYGDKQAPISITLNTNEVTKRIRHLVRTCDVRCRASTSRGR